MTEQGGELRPSARIIARSYEPILVRWAGRLTLEAQRQMTDNSKLVTKILDRELPANIRIVVVDDNPIVE
jgi:hypothetical protein